MLISLAVTVVFSILMSNFQHNVSADFLDRMTTNAPSGAPAMSEADKRKMRETMEQGSSMFQAMFYQAASFGGSLVALFIFSTAVTAEVRKGTIRVTLSKPVSRNQYLLGKYLGGVVVMMGYAFVTSSAILLFAGSQGLSLSPAMKFAPWLMFCRQLMLGSVAMLLSLFVHPLIACALAFFAGNGFYSPYNPLYYLLPSYGLFNSFFQFLQGTMLTGKDVLWLTLYALDFAAIMILFALWRFRSKELI